MTSLVNPNNLSPQWYDAPVNVPLWGKFAEWKCWREGMILESITYGGHTMKKFHYLDSKNKPAYRQLRPDFNYQVR